ncbi:hypothetical protein GGX14DRAFT_407404 [Mycena pura]|uniref:Uncharacterized protein n=1 Tax=Mycena pura TaxID=153505 RepID=A0AAD6Y2B9_9AGAR|nr:hypothetical protein GGX14DRAFT_407404 [Mycena pura]
MGKIERNPAVRCREVLPTEILTREQECSAAGTRANRKKQAEDTQNKPKSGCSARVGTSVRVGTRARINTKTFARNFAGLMQRADSTTARNGHFAMRRTVRETNAAAAAQYIGATLAIELGDLLQDGVGACGGSGTRRGGGSTAWDAVRGRRRVIDSWRKQWGCGWSVLRCRAGSGDAGAGATACDTNTAVVRVSGMDVTAARASQRRARSAAIWNSRAAIRSCSDNDGPDVGGDTRAGAGAERDDDTNKGEVGS